MGMFMAVGRGSDNPPRMIVMRSGEEGERDALGRHLAIVGKGVCFDSGGISIKPSDRMEEMKMDKTGACTVIAAIATVARLAPGTPLLAVAPAVENMPGPHSTRPGDIVTALNGKKVDVTNTDAEGRLILGDALTYAEQLGRDPPRRRRDADRRRLARARAPGDRRVRDAAGLLRRGRWPPATGPASATGSCRSIDDYVPGHGQLVRRPPELRLGRGLAGQERPVHPRVRDQAVGPPRHRRARPTTARPCRSRRAARPACRTPRSSSWRWPAPGPADPTAARRTARRTPWIRWRRWPGAGAAGSALGLVADRFATRWPEHDEEHPPGRPVDWRTAVCARSSAPWRSGCCRCGSAATRSRSPLFGAWFVTLIIGLATDLDQRLLPDVLTLPVIPIALRLRAAAGATRSSATELVPAVAGRGRSSRPSCTCRRSRSAPGRSGWATSSCWPASGCWPAGARARRA